MLAKRLKCTALILAQGIGLFYLARLATARGVRILCYHGAWRGGSDFSGDAMFIRPETFKRRLQLIERRGYPVIPLSKAIAGLSSNLKLPASAVVITFDDAWYGAFADLHPELLRRGLPATIYPDSANLGLGEPVPHVLAYYINKVRGGPNLSDKARKLFVATLDGTTSHESRLQAALAFGIELGFDAEPWLENRTFNYMTLDEFRQFASAPGIDVQLHSHSHSLGDMSEAAIRTEIETNRSRLSELLGLAPNHLTHFCYPSGITSAKAADTLDKLGLESSVTTESGLSFTHTDRQLVPRILDGDHLTDVEFEAELSGFMHVLHRFRLKTVRERRRGSGNSLMARLSAGAKALAEKATPPSTSLVMFPVFF